MWRAVVALIHADGVIHPKELDFLNHYFLEIGFNQDQVKILKSDIFEPQDPTEKYLEIDDIEDRGQFFMFARLLIWCDSDLDEQEEKIFNHLMKIHMSEIDKDALRKELVSSRDDARFVRLLEDESYSHEARDKLSISKIIRDWSVF